MVEDTHQRIVEVADELSERVDVLTRALRWWRVVTALMCVALAVAGYAVWQNRVALGVDCQRDNEARQVQLDLWRPLLVRPIPVPGPDASDAERERYREQAKDAAEFSERLETGFAIHDC